MFIASDSLILILRIYLKKIKINETCMHSLQHYLHENIEDNHNVQKLCNYALSLIICYIQAAVENYFM